MIDDPLTKQQSDENPLGAAIMYRCFAPNDSDLLRLRAASLSVQVLVLVEQSFFSFLATSPVNTGVAEP
jgi:hypothetical protein